MSKWITVHRMVNAIESITFQLHEGEEYPETREQAEEMLQDHIDDYDTSISINENMSSDIPRGYTTGDGQYKALVG